MDNIIPAGRPDLVIINKKRRAFHQVDFGVQVDHRVKIKENERVEKYLDFVKELKKL